MSDPVKIFISYAHADRVYFDELTKHLIPLKRTGRIDTWTDRSIEPGMNWDKEIKEQIRQANFILLLLSKEFNASDYIAGVEMKIAMERHYNGEARMLPIQLSACDSDPSISKLQMLNDPNNPLDLFLLEPLRDKAWKEIIDKIKKFLPNAATGNEPLRQNVKSMVSQALRGEDINREDISQYGSPDKKLEQTFHKINFTELKGFITKKRRDGLFAFGSLEGRNPTGIGRWGKAAIRSELSIQSPILEIKRRGQGPVDRQLILTSLASHFKIAPETALDDHSILIDSIVTSIHVDKQMVVMIHDGDRLSPDNWDWLVAQFWQPLRDKFMTSPLKRGVVFLVFVVTNEPLALGEVNHLFTDDLQDINHSKVLKIPLERNWDREKLTYYIVDEWKDSYQDDDALDQMVNDIFSGTENGVPSHLYENCQKYLVDVT
ncbi:MAG: toll/interleukin-1 receptor domain-containing protein [Blastocatellia bacterium]